MMQVSKKIPFEDPNVLMGVRALYIVSNLLIAGILVAAVVAGLGDGSAISEAISTGIETVTGAGG